MKLYSTLSFKERLEKSYIAQITDTDPKFIYKREFIFRKDNDKESRLNDTYEKRLHGQIVHYEYEYEIKKKGIYECFKIDNVNEDLTKKCVCYIDPDLIFEGEKGFGEHIQYKNIPGLLNALKNNEDINVDNLKNY